MNQQDRFYRLLEDKGWSIAELSRRADVGREQVRRMIHRAPSAVLSAIRVARALNVSVEWLFGDSDDEQPNPHMTAKSLSGTNSKMDLETLRQALLKILSGIENDNGT